MPQAVPLPQKRALGDVTNNAKPGLPSPETIKKRKLDLNQSVNANARFQNGQRRPFGSSQPPKSQFEEEVLEKLTQDISGLKENNSEKDQQWERPALRHFDEKTENICFQQVDAEEGTVSGGKITVKLFGITEASHGV